MAWGFLLPQPPQQPTAVVSIGRFVVGSKQNTTAIIGPWRRRRRQCRTSSDSYRAAAVTTALLFSEAATADAEDADTGDDTALPLVPSASSASFTRTHFVSTSIIFFSTLAILWPLL
jgi:hypothetical protein